MVGKKATFLEVTAGRQLHPLGWPTTPRLWKWAGILSRADFAEIFWLYNRLRSRDFLDYMDSRGSWNRDDFVRTYVVLLGRNSVMTRELLQLPEDVGIRNNRLVEIVFSKHWLSFVQVLWEVIDKGLTGRVAAFQTAAGKLYSAGPFVAKNALEFQITRGCPADARAFDKEAPQMILMGTSVKEAMGTQDVLKRITNIAALRLRGRSFRYRVGVGRWKALPSLGRHMKYRRFQSNLCKAIQVRKTMKTGILKKCRRIPATRFFEPLPVLPFVFADGCI